MMHPRHLVATATIALLLPACSTVGSTLGDATRTTRTAATEVHGAVMREDAPGSIDEVGRVDTLDEALLSPAKDINLRKVKIPPVLAAIEDPYASAPASCRAIIESLATLDAALGPDYNHEVPRESRKDRAKRSGFGAVAGVIGDAIPFRGLVRSVTGANKAERRVLETYRMGNVRRGYLRGISRERGCS